MRNVTEKIHGLPQPPLGYRLMEEGENWRGMMFRRYEHSDNSWPFAVQTIEPDPRQFYAIPLDDGYEYFKAEKEPIQCGDEVLKDNAWVPCESWTFKYKIGYPLRRPKAKPPTYSERQAACGLKVGDRVRVTRSASSYEDGWNASFNSTMENSVGKTGVIERDVGASGFSVRINHGCLWNYPYFVLEKVEERPETVTLWVFQGSSPSIHSTPYTVPLSQAAAIMALLEAMTE